jgi:hypothetical protein
MPPDPRIPAQVNWAQYRPGQRGGHYESFYQRANHPSRPLAFWIRYTIFSAAGRPRAQRRLVWAAKRSPWARLVGEARGQAAGTGGHGSVPAEAVGERWSIVFDGENGEHAEAKQVYPMSESHLDDAALAVRIQDSTLAPGSLTRAAGAISWDLRDASAEPPLYLLPKREVLRAENRALFEILTDDHDHGIAIREVA